MPTALPDNDKPEDGSLELRVGAQGGSGVVLTHFLEYEYTEDFLSPSDSSSFTIDEDELSDKEKAALVPGAAVDLANAGNVQSSSLIDEITITGSRSGGTLIHVALRDWLSPAVDGHVDPKTRFTQTMTLLDVINTVLAPYDVTAISVDNTANRNAITGRTYGQPKGKKSLKQYPLGNPAKPQPNEGAFSFCSRIAQRFGLWIWPTAVPGVVMVGAPDFNQTPRYSLIHKTGSGSLNNVFESHVVKSRKEQPTIIFASGFGGGGEFPKSKIRGGIINPLIVSGEDLVAPIVQRYPGVRFTTLGDGKNGVIFKYPPVNNFIPLPDPNARPVFLYDPESHTQDQLDAYLRRELSLRMRKALTATYTIEGQTLNGQTACVDSMVDVQDDRSDLHMTLWVLGRRFSKSAHAGTRTTLELILPGSLLF